MMVYYSRRLRHTLSSPTTLTSSSSRSSSTRLVSRPSSPLCRTESSPLRATSSFLSSSSSNSSFSSSSSSSSSSAPSTPAAATRNSKKKKRTRKSLAEEQELRRIMDPTYLGQQPQSADNSKARWESGGCGYYANPEGYWHDIDYRPFGRIKENVRLQQRSWTSSSYSGPSLSSPSLYDEKEEEEEDRDGKGSKFTGESLAYWETFTVGPGSRTIDDGHLGLNGDDGDGKSGYTSSRPRAVPSWSYYHHYTDLDSDDSDEVDNSINGEDEGDKPRRVLLKKSEKNTSSSNSRDGFSSSSSWSSSSSSDIEEHENDLTNTNTKPKPKSLNSKSQKLYRTWVTTTFIARLKVIRTKRWLRERVVLCS